MALLIAFPILGALLVLQTTILSRIPLLHGTADLLLLAVLAWSLHKRVQTAWHWSVIAGGLMVLASSVPAAIPLIGYPLVTGFALLLKGRVWQRPLLAMFISVFFGTLLTHGLTLIGLRLLGNPMPVLDALNLITLPSLLLNMVLALPFYTLIGDLANWLYPDELEV